MKNFKNKKNLGFMMVEVLVVSSIITASVLGAMAVAQRSITISRQSVHTAQAGFLLEEGAEAVRILRDNAWTNISSLNTNIDYYLVFSNNTWTLSTTPNTIDNFTRKIRVSNVNRNASTRDISVTGTVDAGTKLITVYVSWVEASRTITKSLPFYIMNIFI
jgi:Tfp pilus assembly protein PilV